MAKNKESKMNVLLTALLVLFVCLLSFGIGVISGKGWSDREYKVRHIEQDTHLKMAMGEVSEEPTAGEEMTEKEIELLTQRAMEEARAQIQVKDQRLSKPLGTPVAANSPEDKENGAEPVKAAPGSKKPAASKKSGVREVSSLPPTVTLPPPKLIEYTVQVAAYKTLGEAENHSQRLIDKGFPAFPVKAILDGQEWYRVSIGSFKNRDQAIQYERTLQKQAVVKTTFVQKIQR